jgi:RNA polymerase sigma factor (sigma-70 family)
MALSSLSDLELLDRWNAGDLEAGNELFERHFDAVYRFFAHKAPDDATDLVQRTFLACVEGRARFRAASSFRTYLFAIARHQLLALWRSRRSQDVDTGATSVADLSPSPSTALVHRREQRVLLEALRALPIDLQIALELHYWEQMSASEIAEVLGVPIGTAKSRLRRGRELLAEAIGRLERDARCLETTLANLDDWAVSLRVALLGEAREGGA